MRAGAARVRVYCNDNFGQWRSDFRASVEACAGEGAAGADIVGRLLPAPGDYFVLKPRHSAFFKTPLALLLEQLEVRSVAVMGVAADACVLMTALDALMHPCEVTVVSDVVAAQSSARVARTRHTAHRQPRRPHARRASAARYLRSDCMPARRKSMALPIPVDDDWQRVQAQIDAVVHENDEAEPERERRERARQKIETPKQRDRR